ncbi:MAG TPA: glycosyltransferase [Candidatus Binatia bacterium]|nr:glycosyltransferase [Candidatus Binatia bacterium]
MTSDVVRPGRPVSRARHVAGATRPGDHPRTSGPRTGLRIAFLTDTFDGGASGGTHSAMRFVDGLRKDHDVTVLTTGGRTSPGRVVLPGLQVPLRRMKANGFTFAMPRRAVMEAAFAGADVVHLQFPFWASFVALACARRVGVPVVAAFHVQPENILYNVGLKSRRLSEAMYRFWVDRFYNRADAVACPTRFAEDLLRAHGLTTPSFVVSNGVAPAITRRTVAREPGEEHAFVLLAVGRLAPEKRHDVLFEAVRRSRHRDRLRLVVAGAGPQERALRRRAQALPHPPLIGFFSTVRLERLYNTADLFVHCSEVELEGMAVLEAMGCGLPVLVADSPNSASKCLAIGPEFRFRSGDPADLAARIDRLVEHPAELARARERTYAAARAYGFEESLARLVDVYRRVVERRAASGAARAAAGGLG